MLQIIIKIIILKIWLTCVKYGHSMHSTCMNSCVHKYRYERERPREIKEKEWVTEGGREGRKERGRGREREKKEERMRKGEMRIENQKEKEKSRKKDRELEREKEWKKKSERERMTEKVSKQIYVNQDKGLVTQSKHIQALKSIYRILNTHEPRN